MLYVSRKYREFDSLLIFTDDIKTMKSGKTLTVQGRTTKWRFYYDLDDPSAEMRIIRTKEDGVNIHNMLITESMLTSLQTSALIISCQNGVDEEEAFDALDIYLLPSTAPNDEYPEMLTKLGFYLD